MGKILDPDTHIERILDVKCVVVNTYLGNTDPEYDWWSIQRAEHDDRRWEVRDTDGRGSSHCWSARLGSANVDVNLHNNFCIEGPGSGMLAIAKAIETGSWYSERRCAATTTDEGVLLESPRNSRFPVLISHNHAMALAADIRAKVPEAKQ